MQPQGESIWGNINLCIEIALNIYYICADKGAGLVIPKDYASDFFSEKTVAAGKESDGCLYYEEMETMDLPAYEIMQKQASGQLQIISGEGQASGMDFWENEEDAYGEQVEYGLEV